MHLGIKGKQVFGVTVLVGLVVVGLSVIHLARLAEVTLVESRARAQLLSRAIFHRANQLVGQNPPDLYEVLRTDEGLRSILESSLYSKNVTYAAIVDPSGVAVAHADSVQEGRVLPTSADLEALLTHSSFYQLRAIYQGQGRNFDLVQPLLVDDRDFGSIRIGVSTLLIRTDLNEGLRPAAVTALVALAVAILGASLLAQFLLRPIHVIRSGLTRLRQGEFGVKLDLDQQDEFGELGSFFNAVSEQLSVDRSRMAGRVANLESAVEHLEDAVIIVSPKGKVLFTNPALRLLLPAATAGGELAEVAEASHPIRRAITETLNTGQSQKFDSAVIALPGGEASERMVLAHPVNDANGAAVGIMAIVRNLEYLSRVESTVRYSRKLAALGRLSAGVAHEVKNPLNAMMIHLELLRQHLTPKKTRVAAGVAVAEPPAGNAEALTHADVIAAEIRRLDDVVQGFLKFTRPEDLKLQPVPLAVLLNEVVPIVQPEADRHGVEVRINCDRALAVNGDPAMLRQAFLNLALNACHAMATGGVLQIDCAAVRGRRVSIEVADTGAGIRPEDLEKIFNLYFTTKPKGSGIGLSMVFRAIQMHDGEIAVQSTVGKGTKFTILLPQAS